VAPGEVHDVGGLELSIVSSHGALIDAALPGAGAANPACRGSGGMPASDDENAMSVGVVARFGSFELLYLGDLYWDLERALACPSNLLGPIDLYQTTHHGLASSGATALVHGVAPLVAVMNNGPHKGGSPEAFEIVATSPTMPDVWQVHRSLDTDDAHNSEDDLVANLGEGEADEGHFIHARIDASGLIELRNGRNGHTRVYQAR
jgi:competence protein ComEC